MALDSWPAVAGLTMRVLYEKKQSIFLESLCIILSEAKGWKVYHRALYILDLPPTVKAKAELTAQTLINIGRYGKDAGCSIHQRISIGCVKQGHVFIVLGEAVSCSRCIDYSANA